MFFLQEEGKKEHLRVVHVPKKLDYSSEPRSEDVERLRRLMAHRTIPFPLEKVRRKVLLNVHIIDKQIYRFNDKYMKTTGDGEDLKDSGSEFLETLMGKLSPGVKGSIDVVQCKVALDSQRFSHVIHSRPEYAILLKICSASLSFTQLTQNCQKLVLESYNEGLRKYCLSFFAEAQGYDLHSVRAYERIIQEKCSTIETILKRLDGVVTTHDKLTRDAKTFIRDFEKVQVLMAEFCEVIRKLEEPLKEWVFADRDYIPQLLEETEFFKNQLDALKRTGKLTDSDCNTLGKRLQRKSWQRQNIESDLHEEKCKLKTQRQRQRSLTAHVEKTRTLLDCRLQELADCKESGKSVRVNRPPALEECERLSVEVEDLREKIRSAQLQLRDLVEEDIRLKKYIHHTRDSLCHLSLDQESVQAKLDSTSAQRQALKRTQQELEEKISALKRIRCIKLHPETVRKIRLYGYLPRNTDMDDQLGLAFRLVADGIGKQWTRLYMKLPFEPNRDRNARNADLDAILLQTQKIDCFIQDAVVKSLERWYRLSNNASLGQLVATLRRIQRKDIVKNVERRLLSVQG